MTCPAVLILSAEAWGFKKEYQLQCKHKIEGHKGSHEPTLPPNVRLTGEGSWAIKVNFSKPKPKTAPTLPPGHYDPALLR